MTEYHTDRGPGTHLEPHSFLLRVGTLCPLSPGEQQPSRHKDFTATTAPGTCTRLETQGREVREEVGLHLQPVLS